MANSISQLSVSVVSQAPAGQQPLQLACGTSLGGRQLTEEQLELVVWARLARAGDPVLASTVIATLASEGALYTLSKLSCFICV